MTNTPKSLPMTEKADTPRTDAQVSVHDEADPSVAKSAGYNDLLSLARQLERELQSARKDAQREARDIAITMLNNVADHVAENSANLRKYAGEENEARCRELAGSYLRECAACIQMDQKLADLNELVGAVEQSTAAIDRALGGGS